MALTNICQIRNGNELLSRIREIETKIETLKEEQNKIAVSVEELKAMPQSGSSEGGKTNTVSATLEFSKWDKSNNTYTIQNENIEKESIVILCLKAGATKEEAKAYQRADIYCEQQSDGVIVLVCYGTLPAIDIPVKLAII